MAAIVTATPKAKRRLRFRASPYELTPAEERHTARALGQGTIPKRNPTRELDTKTDWFDDKRYYIF
jgi:hypothetical protein